MIHGKTEEGGVVGVSRAGAGAKRIPVARRARVTAQLCCELAPAIASCAWSGAPPRACVWRADAGRPRHVADRAGEIAVSVVPKLGAG